MHSLYNFPNSGKRVGYAPGWIAHWLTHCLSTRADCWQTVQRQRQRQRQWWWRNKTKVRDAFRIKQDQGGKIKVYFMLKISSGLSQILESDYYDYNKLNKSIPKKQCTFPKNFLKWDS